MLLVFYFGLLLTSPGVPRDLVETASASTAAEGVDLHKDSLTDQ